MDVIALSRYKIPSPPFSIPTTNSGLEPWQAVLFWWAQKAENSIMAMKIEYLPTLESRQAKHLRRMTGLFLASGARDTFPSGCPREHHRAGFNTTGAPWMHYQWFPFSRLALHLCFLGGMRRLLCPGLCHCWGAEPWAQTHPALAAEWGTSSV